MRSVTPDRELEKASMIERRHLVTVWARPGVCRSGALDVGRVDVEQGVLGVVRREVLDDNTRTVVARCVATDFGQGFGVQHGLGFNLGDVLNEPSTP